MRSLVCDDGRSGVKASLKRVQRMLRRWVHKFVAYRQTNVNVFLWELQELRSGAHDRPVAFCCSARLHRVCINCHLGPAHHRGLPL